MELVKLSVQKYVVLINTTTEPTAPVLWDIYRSILHASKDVVLMPISTTLSASAFQDTLIQPIIKTALSQKLQ
jgi:hypothetical protein